MEEKLEMEKKVPERGGDDVHSDYTIKDPIDAPSPFTTKRRQPWSRGAQKKVKSSNSTGLEEMVLTKGDLDEIRDIFKNVIEHLWGNIEDQYKKVLAEFHKVLK